MDSLGVLLNDVIDLREENEEDLSMSDADVPQDKKRRREEERGFGGTLLGQQAPKTNANANSNVNLNVGTNEVSLFGSSPLSSPVGWDAKSCAACTFRNPLDAQTCDMCSTPFPSQ
jgi:ubiquitin carboxyl-terminal hydrolase 48